MILISKDENLVLFCFNYYETRFTEERKKDQTK